MSYAFSIDGALRVKADKTYPWPCAPEPDRTIDLFDDDVLTKSEDGTYMKHTGLGCLHIVIPDEDLVPWGKPCELVML